MADREIKVVIPTDEEIARLKDMGIDVEAYLVKVFADEIHHIFHPEEEKVQN